MPFSSFVSGFQVYPGHGDGTAIIFKKASRLLVAAQEVAKKSPVPDEMRLDNFFRKHRTEAWDFTQDIDIYYRGNTISCGWIFWRKEHAAWK